MDVVSYCRIVKVESSPPDHASESGDSVYGGIALGTDPAEKIYGLEWESLYTSNGTDGVGSALEDWVDTWADEEATGVVLDHRSGNGGTLAAPSILWDYFVERHESDAYVDRQRAHDERAAMRRGSSMRILRPASHGWSSSASGTWVVLPAPGGASSTSRGWAASDVRISGSSGVMGKEGVELMRR